MASIKALKFYQMTPLESLIMWKQEVGLEDNLSQIQVVLKETEHQQNFFIVYLQLLIFLLITNVANMQPRL